MKYNPKHYNKAFQAEALQWWRTLSINEMKALEAKHQVIYRPAPRSEIAAIYDLEMLAN